MSKLENWLETQKPKPWTEKELIKFRSIVQQDLEEMERRGIPRNVRLSQLKGLGYSIYLDLSND